MSTNKAALDAIYNFEPIADWLGTSGQPTESQFADIANAGYSAVVNLAPPTSDKAIENEGSIVSGHGMTYVQIPVSFQNPTLENLRLFFGVMRALDGNAVWVHCVVNARVSAFVYHYLRYEKDMDEDSAQTNLLRKWIPEMDEVWREFLSLPQQKIRNV